MTPKQKSVEDMILIGQQMSNLCYNLGQRPEQTVGKSNAAAMLGLVRQWDAAVGLYRGREKEAKARLA